MEAVLNILKASKGDQDAVTELKQFCEDNSQTFAFEEGDMGLRRDFIDAILEELASRRRGEEFEKSALNALRILSRDKNGLGLLTSEKSCKTLFILSGLYSEEDRVPGSKGSEENGGKKGAKALTCIGPTEVDTVYLRMMNYDGCVKTSGTIIESLKCLCNIMYHSAPAREHCIKFDVTLSLLHRLKNWADKSVPQDVFYFDLRLMFLLTAFEGAIRKTAFENKGLCILTHALDSQVPGKDDRDRTHSSNGKDGCGEIESKELHKLNVAERFKLEKFPKTYQMTKDQARMSAEILKVIFNVTMAMPKELTHETQEHYERIALITSTLFTHVKALPDGAENVHNHAMNAINSMPKEAMHFLYWGFPKSVGKAFVADFEINKKELRYRSFYLTNNMAAIMSLLKHIESRIDSSNADSLVPEISALCCLAKGDSIIRKYLRLEILPPLQAVSHTRPEEGSAIKNKLIKMMTAPGDIRDMVADFLFILCKENTDRLIKYTGYGNAAGLLARKGLMAGGQGNGGEYSSDEENSDTDEYVQVKNQIDPIIGAIPPDRPNPLDGMTDEEKEEEAMKLGEMIEHLNKMGVIQTAEIGPDGRPREFPPPTSQNGGTN
ncbi:synembryn-A [Nematostella vectensis]|uniref:synembryn-A n=1 Tax=Nematostella vectensis TaxID=45351 RepID=UPI00138FF941|nr:synembryn-A [Nematostella vectensis]